MQRAPFSAAAFASVIGLCHAAQQSPPAGPVLDAALACAPSGPVYSVSIGGAVLFADSLPLALFENGSWLREWSVLGERNVSGADALGVYSGVECSYAAAAEPSVARFIASVFAYASPSRLRFTYSLPAGAMATNHTPSADAWVSTVSNFPGFAGNRT